MIYEFPSRRSVVMGFGGVVAASQPLAAQAGLRMLLQGGTAADAAVAAAAVLNVTDPASTGLGGDVFALIYHAAEQRVYGLNASGRSAYAATPQAFQSRGLDRVPSQGILSVTVPGAAAGWADLVARFGRLGLAAVLQPAIDYAQQGFPLSERIGRAWANHTEFLSKEPETARVLLPHGRAPQPGERVANPDLAGSLRFVAADGPSAFYSGPIAQAIVATSAEHGGLLTLQDFADHTSTWVEPIFADYRGYRVYECPPNGQGIAALIALNILASFELAPDGFATADALHLKMEAIKLGMTDARRYVADPDMANVPVEQLLSAEYAVARRAAIARGRAILEPVPGTLDTHPNTVYLCAADREGNAVSFINSVAGSFGSGLVAKGTGILLQNRGSGFSLDPNHPNCVAPHKRPYHTIIPAMVTRDGKLAICYGVMGGAMQPQGHVQVLCNILDYGMDAQRALDAPRFRFDRGARFAMEPGFPPEVYADLQRRGHELEIGRVGNFGGGQVIVLDPESGAYAAGSEPRQDGCAVAF